MSDIFVSYAHEDRPWVTLFTTTLQKAGGWDIWWDRSIAPGEQFDEVIERAISQARCVIVVWSRHSVASRWVKTEAREAAGRGLLVPVMIEPVTLPLEFRSFETADLTAWRGESDHPQFAEILDALRTAVAAPGGVPAGAVHLDTDAPRAPAAEWRPATPPAAPAFSRRAGLIGVGLLLVALAVAYGVRPVEEPPAGAVGESGGTVTSGLPQLTRGTWTLRGAIDEDGQDFSHSVIEFTSQQPTEDGLAVTGLITWRRDDRPAGTETISGHYVASTRQLFFAGREVTPLDQDDGKVLTAGSYSALLSADERSLLDGRWGSTATSEPGVDGNWEAHR